MRMQGGDVTEQFWLRSYDHESDMESWSNPVDIHTVTRLQLEVQRKGHMTRIYTEAEMRELGWFDQRAI